MELMRFKLRTLYRTSGKDSKFMKRLAKTCVINMPKTILFLIPILTLLPSLSMREFGYIFHRVKNERF
jgi:hypothetical protein